MKTSSSTTLKVKNLDARTKKVVTLKTNKLAPVAKKQKAAPKYSHAELYHSHAPIIPTAFSNKPIIKRNPLGHLLIEKMFREAGFRGGVSSDKRILEKYSTDESIFHIRPQVVIQPKSTNDLEIATRVIARETKRFTSLSLTPRAAGTGLSGGSLTDSIVVEEPKAADEKDGHHDHSHDGGGMGGMGMGGMGGMGMGGMGGMGGF